MSIGLYASFHSSSLSLSPSPREFFNSSPSLRRCAAKRSSSFPHRPREREREKKARQRISQGETKTSVARSGGGGGTRGKRERERSLGHGRKKPRRCLVRFLRPPSARARSFQRPERGESQSPRECERERTCTWIRNLLSECVCVSGGVAGGYNGRCDDYERYRRGD